MAKREIKFRAWLPAIKKMETQLFGLRSDGMTSFNQGSILMQFTGLHDKNGKEIYEGDIIKIHEGNFPLNWWVEYNTEWQLYGNIAAFILKWRRDAKDKSPTVKKFDLQTKYEVIGDIYTSPELLT